MEWQSLITIPAVIALILLDKSGVLDKLLKRNGNGAKQELERLGNYYNHELTEKLEKLLEKTDAHMQIERENNFYIKRLLEEIKTKQ